MRTARFALSAFLAIAGPGLAGPVEEMRCLEADRYRLIEDLTALRDEARPLCRRVLEKDFEGRTCGDFAEEEVWVAVGPELGLSRQCRRGDEVVKLGVSWGVDQGLGSGDYPAMPWRRSNVYCDNEQVLQMGQERFDVGRWYFMACPGKLYGFGGSTIALEASLVRGRDPNLVPLDYLDDFISPFARSSPENAAVRSIVQQRRALQEQLEAGVRRQGEMLAGNIANIAGYERHNVSAAGGYIAGPSVNWYLWREDGAFSPSAILFIWRHIDGVIDTSCVDDMPVDGTVASRGGQSGCFLHEGHGFRIYEDTLPEVPVGGDPEDKSTNYPGRIDAEAVFGDLSLIIGVQFDMSDGAAEARVLMREIIDSLDFGLLQAASEAELSDSEACAQ